MMNGCTSPGGASGRMSGTSFPAHFVPVHQITFRFGSQGFPAGSQEARV
jgi:hypothetical protein